MASAAEFLDGVDEQSDLEELPLSAYTPGQGDPSMEGGNETATGAPMQTLESYERGETPYVTGATSNPANFGKTVWRKVGNRDVKVGITDFGPGVGGLDIAVEKSQWGRNFPYQGQRGGAQQPEQMSAAAFLDEGTSDTEKDAGTFLDQKPTVSRMPTDQEAQTAPHAIPAQPMAQQIITYLKKGDWKQGLSMIDEMVKQSIRRTAGFETTHQPTVEDWKERFKEAVDESGKPVVFGHRIEQPEFLKEYYGDHPDTLLKQGGKALAELPVDMVNFFQTPGGAATAMTGGLSKITQALIGAGFSANAVWDAVHTDDPVQAIKDMVMVGFGALGVKEGLSREHIAPEISDKATPEVKTAPEEAKPDTEAYNAWVGDIQNTFRASGQDMTPQEYAPEATLQSWFKEGIHPAEAADRIASDFSRVPQPVQSEFQRFKEPEGPQILSPEERGQKVREGKAAVRAGNVSLQTRLAVDQHNQLLNEAAFLGSEITKMKKAGLPIPRTNADRLKTINEILRQGWSPDGVQKLAEHDTHNEVAEIVAEERSAKSKAQKPPKVKREDRSVKRSAPATPKKGKTIKQEADESPTPVTSKAIKITGSKVQRESRFRELGLSHVEEEARNTWGEAWDNAAEVEALDPGSSERLAVDINGNPRAANPTESSQLLRNLITAEELHARAVDARNSAKGDLGKARAEEELALAADRLKVANGALENSKTASGRSLNIINMINQKYKTLSRMIEERKAANGGKISEEQTRATKAIYDKIKQVRDRQAEIAKGIAMDHQFARAVARSVMDMVQEPRGGKRGMDDWVNSMESAARKRIVERRGRLNVGFDPTALTDELIIGAAHIYRGLRNFEEWSKEMIKEFGKRIEPHLPEMFKRSKALVEANADRAKELRAQRAYKTRKGGGDYNEQGEYEPGGGFNKFGKPQPGENALLRAKIDAGDVSKIIRRKIPLNLENWRLKKEHERLTAEHNLMVAKDQYARSPGWRKAVDWFVAFERAIKLSGITTLAKILSAAGTRIIQSTAENIVGSTIVRLTLDAATGGRSALIRNAAPLERGFEAKAEAARYWGVIEGIQEIPKVLTGKIHTYETRIPSPAGLDIPGRVHAAGKRPAWKSTYEASKVMYGKYAQSIGKDLEDPRVQEEIETAAKTNADRNIFLQDNVVSLAWNRWIQALESSKRFQPSGFLLSRISRFLLPIVRVPTNVAFETTTMMLGTLTGSWRLMRVMQRGLDTIKPEEADFIMRHYKKGFIGAGLFFTGYFNPDKIGGFYLPGEKRKPGSIHWGDMEIMGTRIPWYLLHAPPFLVVQAGATARKLMDAKGLGPAIAGTTIGIAQQIPFVREISLVDSLLGEGWKNSKALGEIATGTVIPQGIQNIAQWTDEKDSTGAPIKRYPRTIGDYLRMGVPGLREHVPTYPKRSSGGGGRTYKYNTTSG